MMSTKRNIKVEYYCECGYPVIPSRTCETFRPPKYLHLCEACGNTYKLDRKYPYMQTTEPDADLYYIQDSRLVVGNDLLWWAINSEGYTCNINKAGKYTKEEAIRICSNRKEDVAWPVNYIDSKKIEVVDGQYLEWHKREFGDLGT